MLLMKIHADILHERLERIEKMQGSDPGFALISVLSFIESFIREYLDDFSPQSNLPALLQAFGEGLERDSRYSLHRDSASLELLHYQKLANSVRHHFARISREEYEAALARLFIFIERLGIDDARIVGQIGRLQESLRVWTSRKSHFDDFEELMQTGFRLAKSLRENRDLRDELDKRIRELNSAASPEYTETVNGGENEYIEKLRRLSLYARSRRDFERRLIEPSAEQLEILQRISREGDFLISGSAGTGKTLLLILALGRYIGDFNESLRFAEGSRRLSLLTYTSTLSKYNRYLAGLLSSEELKLNFSTVDSLLGGLMESMLEGRSIVYDDGAFRSGFARVFNPECGLSSDEVFREIEDYLFAHNISRELYIDEGIVRRGRGIRLGREQRRLIWQQRDAFAQLMEDHRRYTRNFARIRLMEVLEERLDRGLFGPLYEKLFVDEVQDLNLVDLSLLRMISAGGLVMAGDREQSIFLGGFSFESAGVMIRRGSSAVLRENFRNSREIHRYAEALRESEGAMVSSRRHGPPVEIFSGNSEEELMHKLLDRTVFAIRTLGYSPESICITAPRGTELRAVRDALEARGVESCSVKDSRFSFSGSAGVRLSTLHSVKGLDFASMLVYIPRGLYTGREYDGEIARNLLYVAASRAMELLWFFTGDCAERRVLEEALESASGENDEPQNIEDLDVRGENETISAPN